MNPEAQEVLKRILDKELHELTSYDKGFLKARWTYVGKNSRKKFASIFDEKPEQIDEKKEDEGDDTNEEQTNTFPPTNEEPANEDEDQDDGEDEVTTENKSDKDNDGEEE